MERLRQTAGVRRTAEAVPAGVRIAIAYGNKGFVGLPAPGLYTNLESISSSVSVKGGYNIGSNGPEDGSIYIMHVVPLGTTIWVL